MLTNKTIILGITGSLAAYKAADLASQLTQHGARVKVVMTPAATKFISPLTLGTLTNEPVAIELFTPDAKPNISHIALADAAEVIVIAPATANTIAKLAMGIGDNMLTCIVLASQAPVIIAPAMHTNMLENPATQHNLTELRARGFIIIEPEYGRLASGKIGPGRLPETSHIMAVIKQILGRNGDLAGKHIVVTAGGTQEPIDPARHIGNSASGKMGYALAEAARDRGAEVRLITAPTSLSAPVGVELTSVKTAIQMRDAVMKAIPQSDALIMAAAVADYQSKSVAKTKIKKQSPNLTLELVRTPDILTEVTGNILKVGFAAESENIIENAREKLQRKELDLIVANDITDRDSGFGTDTNKVTIIDKQGKIESLPLMSKREVADRILDRVVG
ncbi:MAG: bifunctional phosphopantothenoylcysteine decarboxylase/phosphopantothenate--cysteine ligase CoaBC, partial [Dehalococcoidales bacterium]|nr:bifunctional phosphopantothenoylcysteine decarboxylase/phosphopantothenate--cysteine ligase CoaBC [Dehalococcoidales bacterium]